MTSEPSVKDLCAAQQSASKRILLENNVSAAIPGIWHWANLFMVCLSAATQQDISTQDRNAQAFYLKLRSNMKCSRAIVFLKDAVSSCQDHARSLVLVARPPSKELLG